MVLVVGASACGTKGDASTKTTGPYAVGTKSLTLVDDTRQTPAFGDHPAVPNRTVVTDIWYPAAGDPAAPTTADAPASPDGPFPLIVFNHGQQGDPQQYTLAFEMWTKAGYVVAAPRHPITVTGGPGGHFVDDVAGELGDVKLVIDQVDKQLDIADVGRLAVAGHSSGAIVAYGVGFNTCCHDDRVDAVLVEALLKIPLDGEYAANLKGTPVMFLHGTADEYPIAQAKAEFDAAAPPKYFVTIEGGNHSPDFRVGPRAELAASAALAFFDYTLKDRAASLDALKAVPGMEAVPK